MSMYSSTTNKEGKREVILEDDKPKKKRPPMVRRGHPLFEVQSREVVLQTGKTKGPTLTLTDTHVIMTPINLLNPTSELAVMAKNDYLVEREKFHSGDDFPLWDDTKKNEAATGDILMFCHNQLAKGRDLAEVFYITKKLPPSFRPKHWLIPDHQNRSVLVLSRYVGYCSVSEVMVAVGSRPSLTEGVNCLRGTVRRSLKHDLQIVQESFEG